MKLEAEIQAQVRRLKPLEPGGDKGEDSLLEPSEGSLTLWTPCLQTSGLQR